MVENEIRTDKPIKITSVNVEIGDRVSAGQVLFTAEKSETDISHIVPSDIKEEDILSVFNDLITQPYASNKMTSLFVSDETECKVYSPIDGVVSSIHISDDVIYPTAAACITIMDPNELQVRASVTEELIKNVFKGMKCEISGIGFRDVYSGTVKSIIPYAKQLQTLSGSGNTVVDVLIEFDSVTDSLIPGFNVNVNLIEDTIENTVLIPYSCIEQDEHGREYVFVVYDNCAYQRFIETGYELENKVQVTSGLYANETVIMYPEKSMAHGERIEVV